VKFSADSKIQRIEVDPLPFEPGTATLTAEGQARVLKIKAFLDQVPDVKMAMTPVVSLRDREPGLSADAPNAAPAALVGRAPAAAVPDLAARRLEAARTAFKQAGADTSRLTETKLAERQGAQGEIDLEILQPDSPRPSKVRELMNRLGVKGGDEN
jgi:hypothetical protein